ncbi:glutathione S-transferase, alpha tandem duplicate 1 [Silurus asotus]|uniref:glutathione transferase n=1 Tax=Silurus asotus TaxID=30991 RepID=A0AAD5A8V4_SILAS|nr:glutathione S-transferase, alpha tandem duplicate 1 [Silurus asotus]
MEVGKERVVALVDMDCFYVQVEQRFNPQLKNKPCVVAQYKTWKGGGIIAVSYEARAHGVTRNMWANDAKKLCPDLQVARVRESHGKADLTCYREASVEVIEVMSRFAVIERASIDEAYMDLTSSVQKRVKDLQVSQIDPELLKNTYIQGFPVASDLEDVPVDKDGALMFNQVPMVEMDGMKLIQSKAILNYIAGKYNLYGKNIKERLMIDMYSEGARDMMDMILILPFTPADKKQSQLDKIQKKAKDNGLPVYEKALAHSQYLVGNELSCADVHLLEMTLMMEELFPTILSTFPKIQEFQKRMKAIPAISKFLQPGSPRKPPADEVYIKTVMTVLSHLFI